MARTATEVQTPAPAPALIESKFDELSENANALIVMNEQDKANVKAMAVQLGYSGPTDPDTLEQVCQIKGAAAAHAIFEFGAALVLLRESCLHGDWMDRFERMSISRRTAHNYMTIALRFKGTDVRAALAGLGVNKMLEMAALNDDEIQELVSNGTLRGHQVGAVDRMSVREMKKKLAELEANEKANERLISDKDKKINELTRQGKKFDVTVELPAHFASADALASDCKRVIFAKLDAMEGIRRQAMGHMRPDDEEGQAVHEAALASLGVTLRDALLAIEEKLGKTMAGFNDTIGMFLPE